MPLEPLEVAIGDRVFTINPLPGFKAFRLAARLGRLAGPSLAGALAGGGLNADALGSIGAFFDRLTPDELEAVTRELLAGALVIDQGKRCDVLPAFDLLFQGRLHEVLQLLRGALVLNYGASFSALVAAASELGQKAASSSTSPRS